MYFLLSDHFNSLSANVVGIQDSHGEILIRSPENTEERYYLVMYYQRALLGFYKIPF